MENSHVNQSFIESFATAREETVAALLAAASERPDVICAPLDSSHMFGWAFEAGSEPEMQGNASYGAAYLRHMINQGLQTAFAVLEGSEPAMVCLKAWEPGEPEPEWPERKWSLVYYHHSPRPAPRA
jgi:hypothetical protein